MRRLLAVALVLTLASVVPSTAHAEDTLNGGEPEDTTTPEPPPGDAVILTVDAEPHEARIDELYEVDWYRFTAVAGQDYWILADTSRGGSWIDVDIVLSLHDANGAAVEVAAENHLNEQRWLLLTGAEAGTYYVRVGVDPSPIDHIGGYGIEIRAIDDDHGNSAADATEIQLATTEYIGRMDYEDDQDWLVFDAPAGDIYRVTAVGAGDVQLYSVRSSSDGVEVERLARWGTYYSVYGLDARPWRFAEAGRYAVAVRDEAGRQSYPGDYTLTFERLSDDHPNTPEDTTGLTLGRETVATVEYRDDEDWFHVDLVDGELYVLEVTSPGDGVSSLEVVVYGSESTTYSDSYVLNRHSLSYPDGNRLLWTAIATGRHHVQVRDTERWDSTIHPVAYGITVSRRAPDDHADHRGGSTPLRPGMWLEGTLDTLGDEDWFRFPAAAWVPYTVEYEIRGEGSEDFGPPEDFRDGSDVVVYFLDDDWGFSGRAGYAFPTAGTQHVLVTTAEWADGRPWDYRLRLVEHERVDHGDDRGSAGPLAIGETVVGSATSTDPDWFYVEIREPGIYAVSSVQPQSVGFGITVLDRSAELPRPIPSFGLSEQGAVAVSDFFSAPSAGRYWIRITAKWAAPFVYRLSVERQAIEPDDHADEIAGATPVPLAPPEPGQEQGEETAGTSTETTATEGPAGATYGRASGRLESYGDVDVFALELRRGVKYRIVPSATRPPSRTGSRSVGYNREVAVSLRDGARLVGSRQSWGPLIEYLPVVTGTYHVHVAYGEGGPFLEPRPYSFEVQVLPQDGEPDLIEGALPVAAGRGISGRLENRADLDWFRFRAHRGQTWILQSPTERWGCVEIYDIAGENRLLKDCQSDRIVWTAPAAGDYAVKIFVESAYGWRSPGVEYDITLSIAPPDDHGNSRADPSTLIVAEPQAGRIDYIGDTDVFRLDATEGELWAIDMTRSYHGTSYETEFVPSDPESAMPATWDRLRVGGVLVTPTDGHWLISVGGARASGDYTVSASRTELSDDYGSNRATAHALEAPPVDPACEHSAETCPGTIVVEGVLNHRFDADYFRLPLVAGGRYEFRVRSSSGGVIFTLLTSEDCALRGPTTWEKSYDTWISETTGDHWIRVGSKQLIDEPLSYTLEVTARGDDFLTLTERATELEPNVVHEVGEEGDSGNNLYRVRLDHPRYVIEVTGGPEAWGTSSGEQFGGSYVHEEGRDIYAIPSSPPVEYSFRVRGGAHRPYTVVVREYVPADEDLEWWYVNISPGFPPGYCSPAGG